MTEQERIEEVREAIDNRLQVEMITLGTDIDDAKIGQMWAFDSERLSKIILSLKDKDGKPMLAILSDDQSYPDMVFYCDECGKMKKNTKCNILRDDVRRVIIGEIKDD